MTALVKYVRGVGGRSCSKARRALWLSQRQGQYPLNQVPQPCSTCRPDCANQDVSDKNQHLVDKKNSERVFAC